MKRLFTILGVFLLFIGCGFILANFISPHTTTILVSQTVQVPREVTVQREERIATVGEQVLSGGYYIAVPSGGINIEPGKTFKVSWSADGNLNVYILTETQFEYFKFWGTTFNYEVYYHGKEGTISFEVRHKDRYYGIVSNSVILGPPIKVYGVEAIITWKETVIQLENKTIDIPQNVKDDLYIYLGSIFLAGGTIGVIVDALNKNKNKITIPKSKN